MTQDVAEPAPSPAAEEAEEAVPETADGAEETQQAAVTPEANPYPDPAPESPVGHPVSPPSPVAAPPAPTPTPTLSPREGKAADVPGAAADLSAAARLASASALASVSASGTASRTICLRTLRGSTSSGALSRLAGWGGTLAAAPAAAAAAAGVAGAMEHGAPPEAAPGQTGAVAVAVGAGGGLGVLPSASKVVDLREVKKVKPGPLASAAAAAPVPAEDSDGPEEGEGPVKIDISAGKRMIEFQLKQNAAEEKRESARLKSERERADAAAAEGSQRMLAQVNARIEAQRRVGGGVLGSWGSESAADHDGGGGGGNAVHLIGPSQMRNLAEKHGIVVTFVDDGAASGVAQVRALARAHGIRIQVWGQDGDGDEAPLGGDCVGKATTPPPILSSLRARRTAPARRSPSPVPEALVKAPPRKTPAAPAGGMFSGPARMMRRALEASGGCVPSAKDASPEVSRGESSSTSLKPSSVGDGDGGEAATLPGRKGGVARPRPGSGGSAGSVGAASNGAAKGGVVVGPDSRDARSEGEGCSSKGGSSDPAAAAAAAAAAPGGNTPMVSGRKRREAPGDTDQAGEKERRGGHAEGTTSKRAVGEGDVDGGGGSGGGAVGGRKEGRLGHRNAGPAAGEGGATPSTRGSKEATTPRIQNGVPKRMRLVAPGGAVVSQAADTPSTHKSGRRTGSGGAAFGPGNNNLFKGAMAGIMGRGKRPAPRVKS